MAVQNKTQIHSDITALPNPITRVSLVAVLDDIVDSYEDFISSYTTVQRNALTPFEGLKIYNTTSNRLEYYSSAGWLPCSQKEVVAIDCSASPNYPEALVGDQYIVSVAGLVGGASGKTVYVGDMVYCVSNNAGGNEGAVGTSWQVCHSASATDNPTFYSEITLSSAEILALGVTPKQLVPAPGAGRIVLPLQAVISFIYGTVSYATNVNMYMGNPTSGALVDTFNISVPSSRIQCVTNMAFEPVVNEKFEVSIGTGNPTAGDSTMTVGVYYKIHTV